MSDDPDFSEDDVGGARTLRLTGRWTLARVGQLPSRLDLVDGIKTIDLSGVARVDTAGAWLVHKLANRTGAKVTGGNEAVAQLIEQVSFSDERVAVRPEAFNPFKRVLGEIGDATLVAFQTMRGLLSFFGAIMIATWNVIRNPSHMRINAMVQAFEQVGVRALAIIGLMSFLIGVVIAQQGAVQLAQFGAEALTINLIGRITTRELGVLMTAIMVAGRSGSAFAAQIGTMKLTEEIDAMRTIGVSPIEALVLPRLIATTLLMPLLGFFAIVLAILGGGLLCWISLEIPPDTYIQRLGEVVPATDLYVGMIKAPVFGAIIAITGCFQGMLVENNAEEVGLKTTSAVVQAIFLVIVLDAFFAVFFTSIGWG